MILTSVPHASRPGAEYSAGVDASWQEQVRSALLAQDGPALQALFDEALRAEGRGAASRSWLSAISAFDADAVTG